ncbi:hypothetical protein PFISCL1PPCAC_3451, partial [Pristionchus fissidentatus]
SQVNDYDDAQYVGNITIGTPGQLFQVWYCIIIMFIMNANSIAPFFKNAAIDGILGLAFQSIAEENVVPPFIEAINQHLVDLPLFTVWLEHKGIQENVPGGIYTYGAVDNVNCGPVIAYQPLTTATYYQFKMSSVALGTYSNHKGWQVISDTGTSLISAPVDIVERIAAAAGARWSKAVGLYILPSCNDQIPPLKLTIGSTTYEIDYKNMVIPVSLHFCPSWILGDPFFRQYCQIYDVGNKRMGFANSLQK